jgi:hypothetical protein
MEVLFIELTCNKFCQLLKRGVLSWAKNMLFKAWRPWCAQIKRRAVLSRIILRWQNKHLKLGFEKWRRLPNQVS